MRFLSVADRELRSAARQKATYRLRWMTAALFFALLVWLMWVLSGLNSQQRAAKMFAILSVLSFIYCLMLSAARTADCISMERREGTLGLLFLTNLNSAEIIAGKLCSSAMASVYGLMAIFPVLALPLLMGGITFAHFWRTVLALLLSVLSGLAGGLLASVLCKRHFTAIALALGLTILLSGGLALGAVAANAYAPTRPLAPWLAAFSPVSTLGTANAAAGLRSNHYWLSVAAVTGLALSLLGLTTWVLAGTWRDRPQRLGLWQRLRRQGHQPAARAPSPQRTALRRRLLDLNPVFWLAARERVSGPVFMVLVVSLILLTLFLSAPYFAAVFPSPRGTPVVGHFFAWLCTGLVLHALVLYYAATVASQRLAEDKQMGALELVLSTPTTERTISRGLWLAFARKMLFPALLAFLVHCFFIWIMLVLMTLDPPGQLPPGVPPGELFWCVLLDQPLRGQLLEWQFSFILRIPVLLLGLLLLAWPTLGWVGRWLGLRMKHPGFAPLAALLLLFVPPVVLFTVICYVLQKLHLNQLPDREIVPTLQWLVFVIACGNCIVLSLWSAICLRQRLRAVAMSRYQPLPAWQWQFPSPRTLRRVALATAGSAAAVALLVASYYGYQNWRSRRAWRTFQSVLQQRGQSLHLSSLLPSPVAEEKNFAHSPAFLALLRTTNTETRKLLGRMPSFEAPAGGSVAQAAFLEWNRQRFLPLRQFVNGTNAPTPGGSETARQQAAAALLQELGFRQGELQAVAAAARLAAFQVSTNRDAGVVLYPNREQILLLERLHLVLQLRACAALALGQNSEAGQEALAGLHLAQLARQFPDVNSTLRVHSMLTRSLQSVWEGLARHAWTESQLADLQQGLAGFDLLSDYTNTVRRVVVAQIEVWSAIPDHPSASPALPIYAGAYETRRARQLQPRSAWFERCMQLYEAGEVAIEQVNAATGRVRAATRWTDLNGIPLDSPIRDLLQQPCYWGPSASSLAFMQTAVNQAVIACALERYRLAQGRYPETLAPLQPALLPCVPPDAVSGHPIIYQYLGPNSFILRGVGPNGIDDRNNAASDDWLWTYSEVKPGGKKK